MASKTPKNATTTNTTATKAPKAARRDADVMLAIYETKRAALIESTAKAVANYDRQIASAKARLSPDTALVEVLAQGYTVEDITALELQLRKAKAGLKGKSPEEIAAFKAQADALNAAKAPVEAAPVETPTPVLGDNEVA